MFTTISNMKKRDERGFTLIELLIVVAIIGILAAVAIPGYIGMQERGRKGAVTRTSEAAFSELQGWMTACKKAGTIQGALTELDTDGDGAVTVGTDKTNDAICTAGAGTLITDFVAATVALNQVSPWNPANALWVDGGITVNQAACDAAAVANLGQITLCYTPDQDSSVQSVFISATDNQGNTIYRKAVSTD